MRPPHKGSLLSKIEHLEPGQRAYIETKKSMYAAHMRQITTQSRYPGSFAGREFTCSLYRALGTGIDDVRLLIAVDRKT